MTGPFRYLALGGLCGLLVACNASTPAKQTDSAAAPVADQPTTASASAEQGPLNSDLLFQVLAGEIAGQRGDYSSSLGYYLQAALISQDPAIAERAVRLALFAGDQETALDAVSLWLNAAPDDLEARQIAAVLNFRQGEMEEAVDNMQRIIELSSRPALGFHRVTALLAKEKNKDRALVLMQKLAERYAETADAWTALARMALRQDKLDEAYAAIDKSLAIKSDWVDGYLLKSTILRRQGKRDESLKILGDLVEKHPERRNIRLTYARMLVEAEKLEDGRKQFQALLKGDSKQDQDVLYALALLSIQAGEIDRARKELKDLIKLGKHQWSAAFYLGQLEAQEGNLEEAVKWNQRVSGGEYEATAQLELVRLKAQMGDMDWARNKLRDMRRAEPQLAVRLYRLEAELLEERKDFSAAMAVMDEAVAKVPEDNSLLYKRGLLGERMDRLDVLERDLRAILDRKPDHVDALNALGYTLVNRTDRYEEGKSLVEKAYALQPDDAAILDSMGWVYAKLGDFNKALPFLQKAYAKLNDSEIAAHLSEVLFRLGRSDEALKLLNEAMQRFPDDALLQSVRKLLP